MASVYPFNAIQFNAGEGDVSTLVSPPYDVLDADDREALLGPERQNIVAIDLPHVPPKELGPSSAYSGAQATLKDWLAKGVLTRRERPAMFAYRQTFEFEGQQYRRCGMACTIDTVPFGPREGGGVLPHEQTFSGPKEDRMALMKATQCQTSPVFGLFADEKGTGSEIVRNVMESRAPDTTARMADGVLHEVWTIDDPATMEAYEEALKGEDIFIADGHHRYTTGLNYLTGLLEKGDLPADHPARRCMIVLVGMNDPGLAIGPTHRVLGGMSDYSIEKFEEASAGLLDIKPCDNDPRKIEEEIKKRALSLNDGANVFGIIDRDTGLCFTATTAADDPLEERFPGKPRAWRKLDVAIIQHLIVEEICQPELNGGEAVKWAFPHTIEEVQEIFSGVETGAGGGSGFSQLAVIVRPTPLEAVKEISRANELMPQKSTFFYPKLATGLFMHGLNG